MHISARFRLLTMVLTLVVSSTSLTTAAVITNTLPFPPIVDGVFTAAQYDDFFSYSLPLLDDIQTKNPAFLPTSQFGDYDDLINGAGTGKLDVIIYTGAQGANNDNVLGISTLDFAAPVNAAAPNLSDFSGTWGDSQTTVGRVLDYLREFSPDSITPVFLFDNVQTGANAAQTVNGRVRIMNGTSIEGFWSLDNLTNGVWDPTALVFVTPTVNVTGTSGTAYSATHNLGSGKTEFAAFAPSMDLSQFNRDYLFVVDFNLGQLNGGPEELFLTGRVAITQAPFVVPEPSSFAIWGISALGLIRYRRWRKVAHS